MKHPTCNFTLKSVQEISTAVSRRLNKGGPFNLIRLGDDEGLVSSISDQSTGAGFNYLAGHLGLQGLT